MSEGSCANERIASVRERLRDEQPNADGGGLFRILRESFGVRATAVALCWENDYASSELYGSGLKREEWRVLLRAVVDEHLAGWKASEALRTLQAAASPGWLAMPVSSDKVNGSGRHATLLLCEGGDVAQDVVSLRAYVGDRVVDADWLLYRRSPILAQVIREQCFGFVLVTEQEIVGLNLRALQLLERFDDDGQPGALMDRIAQEAGRAPSNWSVYLSNDARLDISNHQLNMEGVQRQRLVLLQEIGLGAQGPVADSVLEQLTPRQREVALALATTDKTPARIAEELGLSVRTVRKHQELAYRRLGVHARQELVTMFRNAQAGPALGFTTLSTE